MATDSPAAPQPTARAASHIKPAVTLPAPAPGGDADIAAVARLFADRTRASMCAVLLDGRFHTAGELARHAKVAPSTATEHLALLVAGRALEAVRQGRHRYFRLAGPAVAAVLESLAALAPTVPVGSLRASAAGKALREGRTCYDHLAGSLGTALADALVHAGAVTPDYGPGDLSILVAFGEPTWPDRRPVVRPCVDWTERRYHLAGPVAAWLATRLSELGWVERIGHGRAVRLSDHGREGLAELLPALPAAAGS